MKVQRFAEWWFASVLGLAACATAVPDGLVSYAAFTDGSHDALLGWPAAGAALLLPSWTCGCCGWEVMLLRIRRLEPTTSLTMPVTVFCTGIVTILLALLITQTA